MRTRFLPVSRLLAGALMAVATAGFAEALPRNAVPIVITPEIIRQASTAASPSKDPSYRMRAPNSPNDQPYVAHAGTATEHPYHPSSCGQNSASLCFDYRSGHALYKPMRKLLPDIPGMTPHNLSIRRNRVVAEYTFK